MEKVPDDIEIYLGDYKKYTTDSIEEQRKVRQKLIDEYFPKITEEERGQLEEFWEQPDSKIVEKLFHTDSKGGSQHYDKFCFAFKTANHLYEGPLLVKKGLYARMLDFMGTKNMALIISSGGAGIGKSWGFDKLAEYKGLRPYPYQAGETGPEDYDYVEVGDVSSTKDFLRKLKQFTW